MDFEYQALGRDAEVYYKGPLAENFVATTLARLQVGLYCYKKTNSTAEIEFVVQHSGQVIPLEVKNNKTTAKSLRAYVDEFAPPFSIKLSNSRGEMTATQVHLPIYLCEWVIKTRILPQGGR